MLGVGGVRGDRNRLGAEPLQERGQVPALPLAASCHLLAQPGRDDATDAEPNNGIGHEIAIEQRFDHDNLRGGHGTKALVVCW